MTATQTAARPQRFTWRTLAAAVFVVAAVLGMAGALRGHGEQLRRLLSSGPMLGGLAVAIVVMLASAVPAMLAWRSILAALGTRLEVRTSARIYFLTLLGVYLPGPFWPALTGVHLGRRAGVPAARMAGGYLLSIVVYLVSAAPVAALLLPFGPAMSGWALVLPIAIGALLYWRPRLIVVAGAWVARVARREPPSIATGSETRFRGAMLQQMLSWLVSGVHLWVLAVAVGAPAVRSLPICIGAFAFATAAGALVVIAPDGVGVRELLLTGALVLVLPLPEAITVALASRVCGVAADALGALIAWAATGGNRWEYR